MGDECCKSIIKLISFFGFTLLSLWVFSQIPAKNPTCSIEEFDVFTLNNNNTSKSNHTFYFNLKLKNRNAVKGVFYDAISLSFFYAPNRSFPIATAAFPPFHQGRRHSARRTMLLPAKGVNWPAAKQAAEKTGSVAFRVDLATAVRFRYVFWKTKRHRLAVGADMSVDREGNLVRGKKGVKLTSAAGTSRSCYCAPFLLVLLQFFIWPSNVRY